MKRAILAGAMLFLASKALCAELLVPVNYPTIQSAIDMAMPGDTVIIAPGIYTGVGNRNISFSGKPVTVQSIDPNDPQVVDNTIIDCEWSSTGLNIDADVILDGLTITHGNSTSGGGINIQSSYCSPLIRNCVITNNNTAGYGGGIYSLGSPTITGCTIINNHAVYGGGIYNYNNTIKINRTTITGNFVTGDGGGIYLDYSSLEINSSFITVNLAQNNGGGTYINNSSSIESKGCTFADNTASNTGGGVYSGGSSNSLQAVNSIFWDNRDSSGTGVYAQINSIATVRYCCIQDDNPNDGDIPFGGAENGNIDDDPLFVWLPGDYDDFHLGPDSPCIDSGSPLYKGINETDIDGQPRVIGNAVDMGADEYDKMIVMKRPVEGEVWATGSKHQIKWSKWGTGSVNILLSADNGQNWETVATGITDSNSYLSVLPDDIDSNQCLISVVSSNGDANVICHKSGLFTVRWYPVQPAVPPELQHKGLLPVPDLKENKGPKFGCVKWVLDTNGPVSSQVAITRPYWNSYGIYIASENGLLYALDDQGEFIWSCDINTPIVGSPAVGYYWMVYVAGRNGWLYAIDDDAEIRWTHITDGPVYSTPVVGYSGKIYACSEDGTIYALDGDGSELWTFETKGPGKLKGAVLTTPVIEKNGVVYVAGFFDPNLYALDANNGSTKWVCKFASASDPNNTKCSHFIAPPAIGPDGTIYQTLVNDPNLYAIDPCTGNILWSTPLRPDPEYYCTTDNEWCCNIIKQYLAAIRSSSVPPYYIVNDYLYSCNEGKWQGISALMWDYNYAGSSSWSSPVVGPNGTVYVSFDDPYLRAVEPNGQLLWIKQFGLVGGFTLSIDRDGFIYAAGNDGYVCVVNAEGEEVSRFDDGYIKAVFDPHSGDFYQVKINNWVNFPAIAEDGTVIIVDSNYWESFPEVAEGGTVTGIDSKSRVMAITNTNCDGQQPVLSRPADVQPNWVVDFMDFAIIANNWLACTDPANDSCGEGILVHEIYAPGDINRDLYVDYRDIVELADKWLMEAN